MEPEVAQGLVALAVLGALYMLPTLVAFGRGARNAVAIAVLNVLLGWTGLGWCVALIWSFVKDDKRQLDKPFEGR
jgi:hypothetical protein